MYMYNGMVTSFDSLPIIHQIGIVVCSISPFILLVMVIIGIFILMDRR